jgi:hypothetical protein
MKQIMVYLLSEMKAGQEEMKAEIELSEKK